MLWFTMIFFSLRSEKRQQPTPLAFARWLGLLIALLAGCQSAPQSAPPAPTAPAAVTPARQAPARPTLVPPTRQVSTPTRSAWRSSQPGVEWRTVPLSSSQAMVIRLDPALVRLRVAYNPQMPKRVSAWMAELKPLAVLNGGYFEANYQASALTIADGQMTGRSYRGFGGMLAVDAQGQIALRSLADQPYDPAENLTQALQSFPRLVWDGAATAIPDDNGMRARRTVVGVDRDNRLLLIVLDTPLLTLTELGVWLEQSDLALERALNLDGGPSTGLMVNSQPAPILIDSLSAVPQVLVIEKR